MLAEGVADQGRRRAEIQPQVEAEFDDGYEYAQASPFPEPGDVTKGVWVEDGYWYARRRAAAAERRPD